MDETRFYTTSATVAFTLLGLWWVVARSRHEQWAGSATGRRMATDTSLYFVLAGIMSLLALSAVDEAAVWRISFGAASAAGAANAVISLRLGAGSLPFPAAVRLAPAAALVLYVLIALAALTPRVVGDAVGLAALETEAILVALLLLLGSTVAWAMLADPTDLPATRSTKEKV